MKEPIIIPKGRFKGRYIDLADDRFLYEVIRNPNGWKEYPEVLERAKELRPEFAKLYEKPDPNRDFDDDSIMPTGKWTNHKMKDVPADYLLRVLDDINNWKHLPGIIRYVEGHRDVLLQSAKNYTPPKRSVLKALRNQAEVVRPICEKKAYTTKDEARRALKKIRQVGSKDPDGKIPDRSYECPDCGFWHLTSKPHYDWEGRQ